MFERPHHQRIQKVLQCFDNELLTRANCFFGGGTAIVLALGECWIALICTLKSYWPTPTAAWTARR